MCVPFNFLAEERMLRLSLKCNRFTTIFRGFTPPSCSGQFSGHAQYSYSCHLATECLRAFVEPSLIHSSSLLSRLQSHQLMFVLLHWFSMNCSLVNIPSISCFEFIMSFLHDFIFVSIYFPSFRNLSLVNSKLVFYIMPSSVLLAPSMIRIKERSHIANEGIRRSKFNKVDAMQRFSFFVLRMCDRTFNYYVTWPDTYIPYWTAHCKMFSPSCISYIFNNLTTTK